MTDAAAENLDLGDAQVTRIALDGDPTQAAEILIGQVLEPAFEQLISRHKDRCSCDGQQVAAELYATAAGLLLARLSQQLGLQTAFRLVGAVAGEAIALRATSEVASNHKPN